MDSVLNGFVFIIVVMLFADLLPVWETALVLFVSYFLFQQLDAISAPF
ncbi:MAG: hypothetical protein QXR53_02095 [Candidatus Norongarragalinales archaeon]